MRTWSKALNSSPVAGGKTQGTYSQIGSITIPNKDMPLYLYGILISVARQAVTAGEGLGVELELNSSDLGLYQERYVLENFNSGDPVATNTQSVVYKSEFVPVYSSETVNNKQIDIHLSVSATISDDLVAFVSAIFGDVPIDQADPNYLDELKNGFRSDVRALGRLEQDPGKAHGTANADVSLTSISVPGKAKELVGLLAVGQLNAPTAGEEGLFQFSFESGDIQGFAPQEYPACISYDPPLGTVVGGAEREDIRYYPVRFPLPQSNFDMTVKSRSVIALTNAPNTKQAVKYR